MIGENGQRPRHGTGGSARGREGASSPVGESAVSESAVRATSLSAARPRPRSKSITLLAIAATALVPLLSATHADAASAQAVPAPTSTKATVRAFGLKPYTGPRIAAGTRVSRLGIAADDVLPASVDLTPNTITPGNQGPIGSCVTWSEGYTIAGYYANVQRQTGSPYAPMYLYSQVHVANTPDGGGADIGASWNILNTQGIAERSVYTQGDFDFTTKPTPAEIANAATHKMSPVTYLFRGSNQGTAGITALKAALASGNPVELGIPVYNAFAQLNTSNSVMTAAMATGGVLGGHAIAAVGYNSTGLVLENSWAKSWGAGGYATLAWDFVSKYVQDASVTTGFVSAPSGPVAPVVSGLSATSASTTGGGTMTITGTALASVDATSLKAVQLVNVADPTISVSAPVTSRTATTLTVTIPAAPAVNGKSVTGAYRVVVTSTDGVSTDNGTKDDFTYLAPATFVVSGPTTIAAGTGALVTLTGSGFGTSAAAATALKLSATVNGRSAPLTWISDGALAVTVPAGVPGQAIPIVLTRSGVASSTDSTLKYAAHLSSVTLSTNTSGARYAALTGRGLSGATGWTLTSPDGLSTTSLPVVASTADLASASAAVLISNDTTAQIKLPAHPAGGVGNFKVAFAPSQNVYPGASYLPTAIAVVPYTAPTLASLSSTIVSTLGGSVLTASGTNLTAVDLSNPAAVRLVSTANSAVGVNVPVTAVTPALLTLTVPPAPVVSGAPVTGDYRLVVTTAQGTVTAASTVSYQAPFRISVADGTPLLASGQQVLPVRGVGFGTSAAAFAGQAVTATLGGQVATVTWVNDSTVNVNAATPGTPGKTAVLIVARRGVASNPLTLTYVAAITKASVSTGPIAGGTLVTLSGAGFAGSSTWAIRGLDGTVLTTLTKVTSSAALDTVASGVFVSADGAAVVKMPAGVGAGPSVVAITFTPDQGLYAGAFSVMTSKAVFVYSNLG